jgi:hypothetical protein
VVTDCRRVDLFVPKQAQRAGVSVDRASTETAADRTSPGLIIAVVLSWLLTVLATHCSARNPLLAKTKP